MDVYLVLRLRVPDDVADNVVENRCLIRDEIECAISRCLTGDDTTYDGLQATVEPAGMVHHG